MKSFPSVLYDNPTIKFAIQLTLFHFTNLQVIFKKTSASGVMYHSNKCCTTTLSHTLFWLWQNNRFQEFCCLYYHHWLFFLYPLQTSSTLSLAKGLYSIKPVVSYGVILSFFLPGGPPPPLRWSLLSVSTTFLSRITATSYYIL